MTEKMKRELEEVAQAYCDKMGYELLFVNEYRFGFQTKDEQMYTLTWYGLADKLAEEQEGKE